MLSKTLILAKYGGSETGTLIITEVVAQGILLRKQQGSHFTPSPETSRSPPINCDAVSEHS